VTDILAPHVFIFNVWNRPDWIPDPHCAITTAARRRGPCHYGARLSAARQLPAGDLRGERGATRLRSSGVSAS